MSSELGYDPVAAVGARLGTSHQQACLDQHAPHIAAEYGQDVADDIRMALEQGDEEAARRVSASLCPDLSVSACRVPYEIRAEYSAPDGVAGQVAFPSALGLEPSVVIVAAAIAVREHRRLRSEPSAPAFA